MRRSSIVHLTLLPLLASAAIARADQAVGDPDPDPALAPPGMVDPVGQVGQAGIPPMPAPPVLAPPGMVQPQVNPDCRADPQQPGCPQPGGRHVFSGVIRGGFGNYFAAGGGG